MRLQTVQIVSIKIPKPLQNHPDLHEGHTNVWMWFKTLGLSEMTACSGEIVLDKGSSMFREDLVIFGSERFWYFDRNDSRDLGDY